MRQNYIFYARREGCDDLIVESMRADSFAVAETVWSRMRYRRSGDVLVAILLADHKQSFVNDVGKSN